jgi:hypothetical protein
MTLRKGVRVLGLAGLVGLWTAVAAPAPDKPADAPAQEKPAGETNAKTEAPAKPKVVVFRLNQTLTEKPGDDLSAIFGSGSVSLRDLVERMKRSADDAEVKAVVLLFDGGDMGYAQVEELRQADTVSSSPTGDRPPPRRGGEHRSPERGDCLGRAGPERRGR